MWLVCPFDFCYDVFTTEKKRKKKIVAAEYSLRLRPIASSELISEETVLQKDAENPFVGPGDRREPYRSLHIAHARLQEVFQKEKLEGSPFIVNTPRGWGLVWRWWPDSMGVVLMRQFGSEWMLEDKVTFLSPDEQQKVTLDLSRIVLNPPKW